MYLICYGTRPEMIKVLPLINKFIERNIEFKSLFSGQHLDLFSDFKDFLPTPDYILDDIMESGQSLNQLASKILIKMDPILKNGENISHIVVQGDTTTAYSIALAGFHHKKKIVHLEAGLRTHDRYSPFPEEMNRCLISRIADIHLCPTAIAVNNLLSENVIKNVYNVGNTIVDIFDNIVKTTEVPYKISHIIPGTKYNNQNNQKYILITLHRRENRGQKMLDMWTQLKQVSSMESYNHIKFVYITHPAIPDAREILGNNTNIILMEPLDYISMVHLIYNSSGMITDSGGLQEEAVCANKRVLVCRDTTERPETIESGYGRLIDTKIIENIDFLLLESDLKLTTNPYGENVCDKIIHELIIEK